MRRRSLLVVASILLPAPGAAQVEQTGATTEPSAEGTEPDPDPGGPPPIVELYTMGQGDLIFEKFGHSALCVTRTLGRRKTVCYNYGTTNFESLVPLFWGFVRGRSEFWVSTSSRQRMLREYRGADRTLWRQRLPLAPEQARRLDVLLRENAREENRYYQYHHYFDNCATRLRDLIDQATGGALSREIGEARREHPTFRQLTRTGFAGMTEMLLLSDLMLGRAADQRPSAREAMFLPDVLRAEVEARLDAKPIMVYERGGPPFPSDPGLGGRWLWAALALAFGAAAAAARRFERRQRLALAAASFPPALIGLLLWFLAVATPLPELRWNEALLVFLPTDAALPFLPALWRTRYAVARVALLVVVALLLAVGVLRQPLWLLLLMPLLPMLLVALPPGLPRTAESPSVAAPS